MDIPNDHVGKVLLTILYQFWWVETGPFKSYQDYRHRVLKNDYSKWFPVFISVFPLSPRLSRRTNDFRKENSNKYFFIYTLRKQTHTHTFENNNSKDPKICLFLLLDLMLTWFHFKWSFVKNWSLPTETNKIPSHASCLKPIWSDVQYHNTTTLPKYSTWFFRCCCFLVWNAACLWGVGRVFARFSAVGYVHMKGQVWSALWLQNGFDISLYIQTPPEVWYLDLEKHTLNTSFSEVWLDV